MFDSLGVIFLFDKSFKFIDIKFKSKFFIFLPFLLLLEDLVLLMSFLLFEFI